MAPVGLDLHYHVLLHSPREKVRVTLVIDGLPQARMGSDALLTDEAVPKMLWTEVDACHHHSQWRECL
eukprot:12424848-Karenia_brevis.AAC.1